jgi:NAD(P)-dependent dehydrogenase (short-subunit alcohol dehydrogenase family)
VKEVEALGRGIVARQADVRERRDLADTVAAGLEVFGHLDAVVANAGICPMGVDLDEVALIDAIDVDLVGVMNAVAVALPHLGAGSSIVATGSTAGLMPNGTSNPALGPGGAGYSYAKQTIVCYVETLALWVAPKLIRVNAVHPTNCNTHLLHNNGVYRAFRPDLESPERADVEEGFIAFHAMPIPYIEPLDVSNLILFLVSDESRYMTGQNIRIDAGSLLKWPNGPQ